MAECPVQAIFLDADVPPQWSEYIARNADLFLDAPPAEDDDTRPLRFELMEESGSVSVWLDVWFDEENNVIGWYDHDFVGGTAREGSLPRVLGGCDYADSWAGSAVAAAEQMGITEANNVFLLFDYRCNGPRGPITFDDKDRGYHAPGVGYFLGTFPFRKD